MDQFVPTMSQPAVASSATLAGEMTTHWAERLRGLVPWLASCAACISIIVLIGWAFNIRPLKTVLPNLVTMKVNTVIELLLLTTALLTIYLHDLPGRQMLLWLSIGLVITLGLLTEAEYLFRVNLHIDNFLFVDHDLIQYPGRNSPASYVSFIIVGVAFLLLNKRKAISAHVLLLSALTVPVATFEGYLYRAPGMFTNAPYPVLAMHTTVALTLLCLGGLFVAPESGLMGVVVSQSAAGRLARRLLPSAVAVPGLAGLLVLAGQRAGLYTVAFASALLVACCALLFAAAVWWTATVLWRNERERVSAEAARVQAQTELSASESRYRQLAEERAELLDRERSSRLAAEAANAAKEQFLAVLSHELRTPLMPVLATITFLESRSDLSEELHSEFSLIRRNVELEARLVDDLLNLTRISRGELKLHRETLDVHALIHEAVGIVKPEAEAKRLVVNPSLKAERYHTLADPSLLRQVLIKLIQNAVRFTPECGGCVSVSTASDGEILRITVADLGNGIDPAILPKLFKPFEQGERTLIRGIGGLGLGLAISKSLIEMQGGNLTASSEGRGRGATFTIILTSVSSPLSLKSIPERSPALSLNPTLGTSFKPVFEPSDRACTVLLVEDHDDTRLIMTRLLKSLKCDVKPAANVAEAIAITESLNSQIDLLLSDIGLPDGSGHDVMRYARTKGIRGVALSGFGTADDIGKSREAGFDRHVVKPVSFETLTDLILGARPVT